MILAAKFGKSIQNGVSTAGKSYEVFWSNPDFGYLHYSGAESCPMPIPTIPDRFCALSDYVSAKWGHLYPSWPEIRDAPEHLVGFTMGANSILVRFCEFCSQNHICCNILFFLLINYGLSWKNKQKGAKKKFAYTSFHCIDATARPLTAGVMYKYYQSSVDHSLFMN